MNTVPWCYINYGIIILAPGYSRIPIYDGERSNIVSLLYTKDLVFVDSNDKILLKTLVEFYNNSCFFVFADSTLDVIFNTFKTGMHNTPEIPP